MNWTKLPLGEIAPAQSSNKKLAPDELVWHLTLDQIESHTGRVINKLIQPASEAGSSTYVFDEKNVLYSKLRPYLNKVVYPKEAGIATTELVPLNPNIDLVDPNFLTYYLRSDIFLSFAEKAVSGARMPRIRMQDFWEYLIPLPPLSEQRRIVEILDQADALRKNRAEADEKASRILPALFIKMFGDPTENPMKWKIQNFAELETNFRYGTSAQCSTEPNGLPVLRIPNILGDEIDITDLKYGSFTSKEIDRLVLQKDDLLFVRTNGNPDYVGRCAVFGLQDQYLFASYLIRARFDLEKIDPWYVAACLRTPQGRSLMSPYIRTTAGQSNISVDGLKQIAIPLPPIQNQRNFRKHIENVHKLRRANENSLVSIETLFQTLLHRAFSGELTAEWRKAHMSELLQEMEHQAKTLGIPRTVEYTQLGVFE
jgi:type I restriction enzyme, S subunit